MVKMNIYIYIYNINIRYGADFEWDFEWDATGFLEGLI